jgi:protoporphyrinogen oxidase
MTSVKTLIIGAGITGLTYARCLQLAGDDDFLVLEAEATPGGLCRSAIIDGHVLDTGGGHFLCSRHPEVYDFIYRHIPREAFAEFGRVSKIRIGRTEVDYPLETNLWQLPEDEAIDFIIATLRNGESRGEPAPQNYAEWMRWRLGDRIADAYLLPYNRKLWGVPAEEMDLNWLHKIPNVQARDVVRACLLRASDAAFMPSHASFFYPKQGGFGAIIDAIAAPVQPRLVLDTPCTSIVRDSAGLLVNGSYRCDRVINTAPWDRILPGMDTPDAVRAAGTLLRHNTLQVALYAQEFTTDAHWIYVPDIDVRHHREFFIPNYALDSKPGGMYTETEISRWQPDPRALAVYTNPYAYPIPSIGWEGGIATVLAWAREQGVHGVGRWGQWQYFNGDVCIREAMQLFARLG